MKDADMPAMPIMQIDGDGGSYLLSKGLTKREHACIALRVPETGDPELDALIRTAQRRDVAAMAMQGLLANGRLATTTKGRAVVAVEQADALLAALEPKP